MTRKRQPWGSVRKLRSGRFQARYRVDGVVHTAPRTFATKREADAFLAEVRTTVERGTWANPTAGKVTLRDYSARWLADRVQLRIRTRELYEGLLRRHILPALGDIPLLDLRSERIRSWNAELLRPSGPGASTTAKAYRLLRTIMNTALEDGLVTRNPCVLKGAGIERPAERPVATIEQVYALADAIEPQFRALVLLATFTGMRLGELIGLRRPNLDLLHVSVRVVEQILELDDGTLHVGPPKSDAGIRTIAIPMAIVSELETHLGRFSAPAADGFVFPGTKGQPMRRGTLYAAWHRALRKVGLKDFHFHDLRHTGNTLAAAAGASTKELMARMGHSSTRAALIYQHAVWERDVEIAGALSDAIERVLERSKMQATPKPLTFPGADTHTSSG